MGELAVAHESGAVPGPHRQPSTSESPATAGAGTWVPAEVGAASGEPPVDNQTTASGNSGYMDTPDRPLWDAGAVRLDAQVRGLGPAETPGKLEQPPTAILGIEGVG